VGGWKRFPVEELHNLYSTPYFIFLNQIRDTEMGGSCLMHTKFFLETLKGRDLLDDVDVDGRLILELVFEK
jgi:hypothetical protein